MAGIKAPFSKVLIKSGSDYKFYRIVNELPAEERTFLDVMKWLHKYLEYDQKKTHVETQVKLGSYAALGNTINTDWDGREGGNEKALITPKTPSTEKAMAKAITSTDQTCFRGAALQPSLQQHPGLGCLRITGLEMTRGACHRNGNDNQGKSHWVACHHLDSVQCQALLVVTKSVFCPPHATKAHSETGQSL